MAVYESVSLRYSGSAGDQDVKVHFDEDRGRVTIDLANLTPDIRERIKNIVLGGVGPGPRPCMVLNLKCEGTMQDISFSAENAESS